MGHMTAEEVISFESELEADPQLREEVALQRSLILGIEDHALKEELKELHGTLVFNARSALRNKVLLIVGSVLLGLIILWGILKNDSTPPPADTLPPKDTVAAIVLPDTVRLVKPADTIATAPISPPQKSAPTPTPALPPPDTSKQATPIPPDTIPASVIVPDTQKTPEPSGPKDIPGMVFIPGGGFTMGGTSGNATPSHRVNLGPFYLDQYEVTNAQYCHFLNSIDRQLIDDKLSQWLITDPSAESKIAYRSGEFFPRRGFEEHPVVAVTWHGAKAYAQWSGKRLPTEAEWEYAARGGNLASPYLFAGSNSPSNISWNQINAQNKPHPVGTKRPNALGLYDMSGNVWEWCNDRFGPYHEDQIDNPIGPTYGTERVLRGGSFKDIEGLRVNARWHFAPHLSREHIGFRCAVDE